MRAKIYSLHESDGTLRYVGKTKNELDYRLNQHIRETRSHTKDFSYRCNWFRKLLNNGCIPSINLIEEVEGDGVTEERYWIKHYRDLGYRLVNTTEGGEGLYNPSQEVKDRIANKHFGMKASKETRLKMSMAHKGKSHPNGLLGHKHSQETKNKMKMSSAKRWEDPKEIQKMIDSHKDRKFSEEHIKNICIAQQTRRNNARQHQEVIN